MTAKQLHEISQDEELRFSKVIARLEAAETDWHRQLLRYWDQGVVNVSLSENLCWIDRVSDLSREKWLYQLSKALFDRTVALMLIVFFAPVFVACAIIITLESPGGVFFLQTRLGHLGRPFRIIKFRTMYSGSQSFLADIPSDSKKGFYKAKRDPRISRAGRLLRRWSLDELPQLLNVLKGEMSVVGPRPLPLYDVAVMSDQYLDIFAVPQGLTGLWQVTARGSNDAKKNLQINLDYAKNCCWTLDIKILLKTVPATLTGRGAR